MTRAEALDDIERRLDALGPDARSVTLEPSQLLVLGVFGVTKKHRRRLVNWARRKIAARRQEMINRVTNKLTL